MLRAYEGNPGKNLEGFLAEIQKGARKPIAEGAVTGLNETGAVLEKVNARIGALTWSGTLTVPETGVWEFEVDCRGGLFFPQPDGSLEMIGRTFPSIGTVVVALEKGSHPILLLQTGTEVGKGGKGPGRLRVRQPGGNFEPIPPGSFRH